MPTVCKNGVCILIVDLLQYCILPSLCGGPVQRIDNSTCTA